MPDAAACAHPFDATRVDNAFAPGRFLVEGLAGQDQRQCRDAGMGVESKLGRVCSIGFEMVKKYERLDQFADIARTYQPGNGAVRLSARTQCHLALLLIATLGSRGLCVNVHLFLHAISSMIGFAAPLTSSTSSP